jgi:hypothetical protein
VASYVLLEGTITSQSHAAFLVAIFWACITGGRYGALGSIIYKAVIEEWVLTSVL